MKTAVIVFPGYNCDRDLAVAPLTSFGLTGDHDPARLMPNAHGRLNLVHVLPAFTAASKRVDLQIGRINFDRRGIGNLGNDIDAGK